MLLPEYYSWTVSLNLYAVLFSCTCKYSGAPLSRSPKEPGKKFEIAERKIRNNESCFNKIQYSIKKDTD